MFVMVVAVLSAIAMLPSLAVAKGHRTTKAPVVVRLKFARVGSGLPIGGLPTSDGRYVLLPTPSQVPIPPPTVIDEQTQQRLTIPLPGPFCTVIGVGGTDVFFSCGDRWQPLVKAYSLVGRQWEAIPQYQSGCVEGDPTCSAQPSTVGSEWIEYQTAPCYHCGGSGASVFQNLHTGQTRLNPASSTTIVDPDARSLAERVCPPLRIPRDGLLSLVGHFAIADYGSRALLERCGSKRPLITLSINDPLTVQARAAVWQTTGTGHIDGLELPSLRRLTIPVPKRVYGQGQRPLVGLLLTSRSLYLTNSDGQIWSASATSRL